MPRKSHRGVHPSPWQCTSSHACHAKATEAYIRAVGSAHCPTPATQKPPAERRRRRDARAYIRPLAEHQVPHLPRKSHRQSGGDQGTPGCTSDPLAVHQVPRLPRQRLRWRSLAKVLCRVLSRLRWRRPKWAGHMAPYPQPGWVFGGAILRHVGSWSWPHHCPDWRRHAVAEACLGLQTIGLGLQQPLDCLSAFAALSRQRKTQPEDLATEACRVPRWPGVCCSCASGGWKKNKARTNFWGQ